MEKEDLELAECHKEMVSITGKLDEFDCVHMNVFCRADKERAVAIIAHLKEVFEI